MFSKQSFATAGIIFGAIAALLIFGQAAPAIEPDVELEGGVSTVLGEETSEFASISTTDFNSGIQESDVIVLDVRTADEFNQGHIDGAINLDYYSESFADQLNQLDRSVSYKVYCRSGNRSGQALSMMRDLGFSDVQDLAGGISAWQAAGLAVSDCVNC